MGARGTPLDTWDPSGGIRARGEVDLHFAFIKLESSLL